MAEGEGGIRRGLAEERQCPLMATRWHEHAGPDDKHGEGKEYRPPSSRRWLLGLIRAVRPHRARSGQRHDQLPPSSASQQPTALSDRVLDLILIGAHSATAFPSLTQKLSGASALCAQISAHYSRDFVPRFPFYARGHGSDRHRCKHFTSGAPLRPVWSLLPKCNRSATLLRRLRRSCAARPACRAGAANHRRMRGRREHR